MKILVTGASGFIGSYLCRRLTRDGHAVTALIRPSSDAAILNDLPVDRAIGDITQADAVSRAVQGHEAVIHAAAHLTIWRQVRAEQDRVNVEGTRNVVNACVQHSVRRLVHISSVAAVGLVEDPNCPATEDSVFNLEGKGLNYHLSKHRAEQIVLSAVGSGLNAVVVNPSSVFGRYRDHFRGAWLLDQVRRRTVVFFFRGGISPVHVDDVVEGIVAALARGQNGQRYILAGENLTNYEIAKTTAQRLGLKRHFVPIPNVASALAAAMMEPIGQIIGKCPPITYDLHYCAQRYEFYDSSKASNELGYNARSFIDILNEYASNGTQ